MFHVRRPFLLRITNGVILRTFPNQTNLFSKLGMLYPTFMWTWKSMHLESCRSLDPHMYVSRCSPTWTLLKTNIAHVSQMTGYNPVWRWRWRHTAPMCRRCADNLSLAVFFFVFCFFFFITNRRTQIDIEYFYLTFNPTSFFWSWKCLEMLFQFFFMLKCFDQRNHGNQF